METYRTWMRLFELLRYYSWIIDRFHLSTRLYQLDARGKDYDFGWLEERLKALGFHLVLCTRKPATFEAALEKRLLISGKPSQYDGVDAFIREQERYRLLAAKSALPVMELDISDGDVGAATDRIADWMEHTGGLWAST